MWRRGCSSIRSRVSSILLLILSFLSSFPEYVSSAVVTLHSIEIYKTHEWLKTTPTIYFYCTGENRTILPDVTEANVLYDFRGEESWQPLTELFSRKCKRCGFYEQDLFKLDNTFDEWELCPSDFTAAGKYTRAKHGELNATFLCSECLNLTKEAQVVFPSNHHGGGLNIRQIINISVGVAVAAIVAIVFAVSYKHCQKRRRQREQARFMKLFEEGDDIEDELGLGDM